MLLLRYIARRVVFVVPQLFGIVLVSFFLVTLIPGAPAVMMLGPTASAQSLAELRDRMGLTKPLLQQFTRYVTDVAHGDLGTSWQTTRPVTEDLFQRFPATLELITSQASTQGQTILASAVLKIQHRVSDIRL